MKKNISISAKFLLVSLTYTLPICTLLHFMLSEKNKVVRSASLESTGIEYLKSANRLLTELLKYQITLNSFVNDSDESLIAEIDALESGVDKAFDGLGEMQQVHGESLQIKDDDMEKRGKTDSVPAKMAGLWKKIKSEDGLKNKTTLMAALNSNIRGLISYVGDTSGLVLDAELETFYLMDAIVTGYPSFVGHFEAYTMGPFANDGAKQSEQIILQSKIESDVSHITASTTSSFHHDRSGLLQASVKDKFDEFLSQARIFSERRTSETPKKYLADNLKFIDSSRESLSASENVLESMLNSRIESSVSDRMNSLAWVLGSWLFASLLAFFLQKGVHRGTRKVFEQLQSVTEEISRSSAKLDHSAQNSSAATTREAAAIQQSVAAMAEMTSMLEQTAHHTHSATDLTVSSLSDIENGKQTMHNMTKAMSDIAAANARLKEITKIIGDIASRTTVINDIVFKTQLLAVNAAIEAARAGHHGKGFAVVANEVSNLAALSGKASSEIRQLLDESKMQVADIVSNTAAIVQTGQNACTEVISAFQDASKVIATVGEKVRQIDDATREQEAGIRQTSQAMVEINTTTSANTSLSRENAILSQHIKSQGVRLGNIERAMSYVVFGAVDEAKNGLASSKLNRFDAILDPSNTLEKNTKSSSGSSMQAPSKINIEVTNQVGSTNTEDGFAPQREGNFRIAASSIDKVRRESLQSSPVQTASHKSSGRFEWKNSYDIGVAEMNDEHQILLRLMKDLETAYNSRADFSEQEKILDGLAQFTVKHFADEERYFDSIGYPDSETHKGIHKNLLGRLQNYAVKFKAEKEIGDEFFAFLKMWLSAHIQGVDIRYGQFANQSHHHSQKAS